MTTRPDAQATMIHSRHFAAARKRVLKATMGPHGFRAEGSELVCRIGPTIQYVAFGAVKFGHGFDVRLAVHWDYLPPFAFRNWPGAPMPKQMCHWLAAFQSLLRREDGSQHYEYGESVAEAEAIVEAIARRAKARLDDFSRRAGDGRPLLELLAPDVLADDLSKFDTIDWSVTRRAMKIVEGLEVSRRLPEWWHLIPSTAAVMAHIAKHFGRNDLVTAYVAISRTRSNDDRHLATLADLLR
jgi:hypothetical protein